MLERGCVYDARNTYHVRTIVVRSVWHRWWSETLLLAVLTLERLIAYY